MCFALYTDQNRDQCTWWSLITLISKQSGISMSSEKERPTCKNKVCNQKSTLKLLTHSATTQHKFGNSWNRNNTNFHSTIRPSLQNVEHNKLRVVTANWKLYYDNSQKCHLWQVKKRESSRWLVKALCNLAIPLKLLHKNVF